MTNLTSYRVYRVYMHRFPNGKRYIGMTKNSMARRWDCGRGYIGKVEMWDDIVKYGWDNVEHTVYTNDNAWYTKSEAEQQEKHLIALWDTTSPYKGYNLQSGGISNYTENPSSIAKRSNSRYKAILQYDRDGALLNEFISVLDAARVTGIYYTGISDCARGIKPTAGDYIWKYKQDVEEVVETETVNYSNTYENMANRFQNLEITVE